MSDYDVIVIGSGAGGGTLVRHLAPSGKRILLLERGDWLPREPQNWLARDVFVDNRYVSQDTWYDGDGKPFQPQVHYFVGGATKLYGAALYRLREEDFGELRHHDGISPAWPIAYDEMEPYYTRAEQLYQVHGARGEDPTEPPASAPYPFPAVSHEPRIQQLADDLEAAGHQPFHAPCGVMLDEDDMPHSACVRCATCDGFPCLVHAKSDAEVLGVRPALEHPNVTLLTNAQAVRLETNDAGTAVTGVVVERDGAQRDLHGRHRRRLLRRGQQRQAAARLGQRRAPATAWPTAPTRSGATTCSTTARPCWRSPRSRTRRSSRRRSGSTTSTSAPTTSTTRWATSRWSASRRPRCTAARSRSRRGSRPSGRWRRSRATRSTSGSRPRTCRWPENRVTLRDDGSIALAYTATNDVPKKRLLHELKSMLKHLGMHHDHLLPRHAYLKNDIPVAGCAHQAGTCRFGDRPGDLGARHRLPGARGRQPLRRRHELLPEHRRGEPGADRDGQRGARRRPPPRAPGRSAGRTGARACRLT